jgi:hypothetical protein
MNSDRLSVVSRTALPREFDQGHGGRRPMANRALRIYSQAPLAVPTTCCVEHCGRAATRGAFCDDCFTQYEMYNRLWAAEEAKAASGERRALVAGGWRFVNGFAFFGSIELLVGYCIKTPLIWQSFALGAGCALVVALGNALIGGGKAGAAR